MASLKTALLLLVCLQGCGLTSAFTIDGLQNPDVLEPTGDVCKDCTQIFELVVDLFSNPDIQKKIMNGIEDVCKYLPGPAGTMCKDEVEKLFPMAITFITGFLKPADVCKIIGLCGASDKQERMLVSFIEEALEVALASKNEQPQQCSLCILIVKTLEDMLPKERTEESVIELLEEICHILPSHYRDQCKVVIDKFSKPVLDAILSYASPKAICTLIHQCNGQEAPVDPCTSTAYRCRDIKTALKCGTLFYCQKYAWKPLNSNML